MCMYPPRMPPANWQSIMDVSSVNDGSEDMVSMMKIVMAKLYRAVFTPTLRCCESALLLTCCAARYPPRM